MSIKIAVAFCQMLQKEKTRYNEVDNRGGYFTNIF